MGRIEHKLKAGGTSIVLIDALAATSNRIPLQSPMQNADQRMHIPILNWIEKETPT